ncbi:ABC transporter substrate binding protein [Neptuniibacter sp. CAU 1671]|uniref:ABC transporter substrate-binding protein n=1 Tax=Neptuniibacter sp. CAU 1671 TaxID=3032593 RepID=UPI0023D99FCC|nr:ABC transporter substrate binding protein [Neptuniibacter sp. CAU 1671]MDF2181601.1 ABC transporter substrate binding protein [Neptuniibacter sp. CAU 1671]
MPIKMNKAAKRYLPARRLCGLLLALLFTFGQAHARVLLITSGHQIAYQEVVTAITHQITEPFTLISMDELSAEHSDALLYPTAIAIGSQAADQAFGQLSSKQALIMAFLPRRTYLSLMEKYAAHPRQQINNFTAVFLDQPLERQFNLIRIIKPDTRTIATALGPFSSEELPELMREGEKNKIGIKHEVLSEDDNPMQKLQSLIAGSDVVLTLPDKSLFNRTTAKWILYISFRQGIPLIGFSDKYVTAGALAAVYSDPADIGKQTAEVLSIWLNKNILPKAQFPRYFKVATNPVAARSLHIQLQAAEMLEQQLKGMEP